MIAKSIDKRAIKLKALEASLTRGIADADAGRVKPAAEVFERLEKKYRELLSMTKLCDPDTQ